MKLLSPRIARNASSLAATSACLTLTLLALTLPCAAANVKAAPVQEATEAELRRFNDFERASYLLRRASVRVHWLEDGKAFWFETDEGGYRVDTREGTKERLASTPPEGWEPERQRFQRGQLFSPDFERYLVSRGSGLWLHEVGSDAVVTLAEEGVADVMWRAGSGDWSPDGTWLVAFRTDRGQVHKLPIIDYSQAEETVREVVYSKSGGGFARMEAALFELATGRKVVAELGTEEEVYLYSVGWREDGSEHLLLRMTRDAKRLDLVAVHPATGEARTILSEEQETFVGGLDFITGGYRATFTPIEGTDRFLWLSERDGWRHVYLYTYEGDLIGQLTRGDFPVTEVAAVDATQGVVYLLANAEERLYDTHLYRVGLDGAGFERLTEGRGEHEVDLAPDLSCFVDTHSSCSRAPVSELRTMQGELLLTFAETDTSRVEAMGWSAPEEFVVKADDGETDLYGVLYKPADFDPEGSYPVIDLIYAGPFTNDVPNSYLPRSPLAVRAQAMAQLGFITFMVDCRGTTERGKAFQDASYGRIGEIEIPDHVATLYQLAEERFYMDLDRVGIYGASWGGYFVLRAMLSAPEVFHVGVAAAPGDLTESQVINEPYMGLPQDNPEGYEAGSNPKLARNLRGKLLMIHGTADRNAPLSTTMRMSEALIRAGKLHDLAVLPQADHYFDGHNGRYLAKLVLSYFKEHLGSK